MSSNNRTDITLSDTDRTGSQSPDAEIDLSNYTLYTRFGGIDSGAMRQHPRLHSIHSPLPNNAQFGGPIHLLTEQQVDQHEGFLPPNEKNSYAIQNHSCVAKKLQDECEDTGRVLYPIRIESDAMDDGVNPSEMLERISQFVRDRLPVSPEDCTFYYSGNRSIHCHVPLFIRGEDHLSRFKERVKAFNPEDGIQLDSSNYTRKPQFRLPGVVHKDTDEKKIRVDPEDTGADIARKIDTSDPNPPSTYSDLLTTVFQRDLFSTGSLSTDLIWKPDESTNTQATGSIFTPRVERKHPPFGANRLDLWYVYNPKEFSPYAKTGDDNPRSWAVVTVRESAFCRPEYGECARLPCFFYYALGADDEFTKSSECAPLLLSDHDYQKVAELGVEAGDHLVVIGGQSRKSKILNVTHDDTLVSAYLSDSGREAAGAFLTNQGYDVGSSDMNGGSNPSRSHSRSSPPSNAERLQRRAETDGIRTLSHPQHLIVGNRLLRIDGYDHTYNWFKHQYGPNFKPDETHRQLCNIMRRFSDLPDPPAKPPANRQ